MKLSERQKEILKLCMTENYITSKDLSRKLYLSDKTVRSEMKQLSQAFPGLLAMKKGKGFYAPDLTLLSQILTDQQIHTENRQLFIFKHILTHAETDFYQLADQYYISESTLQQDIAELNRVILAKFNTTITRKKNLLCLDCDEEMRRKIYTHFLMNEIENYNFDLANYNTYFKFSSTDELKEFVISFFKTYQIRFNDIEIVSFIIHVAIAIERVKNQNSLKTFANLRIQEEQSICDHFCDEIEQRYKLHLNEAERNYIASLLSTRINTRIFNEQQNQELLQFIETTLSDISNYYQIELAGDDMLKHNLLIHLLALHDRINQKRMLNNPLVKEIKDNFPLIYDIAVYVSLKIQDYFHIILIEDEIGFIALHVMCSVEKMRRSQFLIAVIDPIGNRQARYYEERLQYYFPNCELHIACFSMFDFDGLLSFHPGFIITTIPLKEEINIPTVYCSSLLLKEDIDKISTMMQTLRNKEGKNQLLLSQFSKELFFPALECDQKAEVLRIMCDALQKQGYCDENYFHLIMERENIAPTCFGNLFAIPHPIKKEAWKSGIAIAILQHPLDWNGQKVKLVFLFSLTKNNDILMKLYEEIVSLLDDLDKVRRLAKQETFESFIEEFLS